MFLLRGCGNLAGVIEDGCRVNMVYDSSKSIARGKRVYVVLFVKIFVVVMNRY